MFIGELIRKYRKDYNLSQRDFAKRCNLSHTYIAALEKNIDVRTGKPIAPTLEAVKSIASAMNIDVEDLLKTLDGRQEFVVNATSKEQALIAKIPILRYSKSWVQLVSRRKCNRIYNRQRYCKRLRKKYK